MSSKSLLLALVCAVAAACTVDSPESRSECQIAADAVTRCGGAADAFAAACGPGSSVFDLVRQYCGGSGKADGSNGCMSSYDCSYVDGCDGNCECDGASVDEDIAGTCVMVD